MKKLIFSILVFSLFCANKPATTTTNPVVNVTDPTAPAVTDPVTPVTPPAVIPQQIQIAILTPTDLKLWDGVTLSIWHTGAVKHAGFRQYTFNDILYNLDNMGATVSSLQLACIPDFIQIAGSNIWTFSGTQIFFNYTLFANYAFVISDVYKTMLNDIIYEKNQLSFWDVNNTLININYVSPDGLLIHNFDPIARTATMRTTQGYAVSWATNYMNNATQWQVSSTGKWYSQNGYTWDSVSGLTEGTSAMWAFNFYPGPVTLPWMEWPTLINIGVRFENGESVFYWLECNSGWIVRYVPSINQVILYSRIYQGDNTRNSGQILANIIKPVIVNNAIYFNLPGSMYKLDMVSGSIVLFYAGNGEVFGW